MAGDRIAGGVGVHETALASPETVDLGGRCVLPGFTDSHVHFPTWAVAQHEVKLDGCTSLDEALARIRDAPATGAWLRGYGWRSGDWRDTRDPTKVDLDPIAGDRPAALIAKDNHSLGLNSAALALADGVDARRQRRADHERQRSRRDRARRRSRRLAGRRARDRRPRESRSARRLRADPRRLAARGTAATDRARAMPLARGPSALRRARRRSLRAVHA